jgi:hypothetical protein
MSYTTVAAVKTYLGITATSDDALLGTLLVGAQGWIDRYTGRVFECATDTTRYLDYAEYVDGLTLRLPGDLCQITSISNAGVAVLAASYVTHPRHATPWYALELKASAGLAWQFLTDTQDAISITGRWAYSLSAPDDIAQAALRLTSFLYRQKDAQVFDVTAQPDMGIITVPQGMPRDVKMLLAPYRVQI